MGCAAQLLGLLLILVGMVFAPCGFGLIFIALGVLLCLAGQRQYRPIAVRLPDGTEVVQRKPRVGLVGLLAAILVVSAVGFGASVMKESLSRAHRITDEVRQAGRERNEAPANPPADQEKPAVAEKKEAPPREARRPPAAKPAERKLRGVGETFTVGNFACSVHEVTHRDVLERGMLRSKAASGEFLVLRVTLRNDSAESRVVPPFELIDADGAKYDETDATLYFDHAFTVLETLNPGISKTGELVFQVPDRRPFKLQVSGGMLSGELALVDLGHTGPIKTQEELAAEAERREERRKQRELDEQRALEKRHAQLARAECTVADTTGPDKQPGWHRITVKNNDGFPLERITVEILAGDAVVKRLKMQRVPALGEKFMNVKLPETAQVTGARLDMEEGQSEGGEKKNAPPKAPQKR